MQNRNPEGAEVFGPSTFEGYRWVRVHGGLRLSLQHRRDLHEVRSQERRIEDGCQSRHTRDRAQAPVEVVEHREDLLVRVVLREGDRELNDG